MGIVCQACNAHRDAELWNQMGTSDLTSHSWQSSQIDGLSLDSKTSAEQVPRPARHTPGQGRRARRLNFLVCWISKVI